VKPLPPLPPLPAISQREAIGSMICIALILAWALLGGPVPW
jgi:hypothetical protein